jgi:cytochrome c
VAFASRTPIKSFAFALAFGATIVAMPGAAADDGVQRGRQLAQARCASCHMIAPQHREELADAPPFDVIARKANFDSNQLINLLTSPHHKMNFALSPSEAADIAAYMHTLAR